MTPLALVTPRAERLGPLERVEALCDPGSLQPVGGDAAGVVGATGCVDARPIACYSQAGSSLGAEQADTIVRVLELAGRAQMPLVAFTQGDAVPGGRILRAHCALAGQVPQVSVICGRAAAVGLAPVLTDTVVMTQEALGELPAHERDGVCQIVAAGDLDAAWVVRDLLDYLPPHRGARTPRWPTVAPPGVLPDATVPDGARGVYDVRDVIRALVDGGRALELGGSWAPNVVTAYARLDGYAVGILANQPRHLGGALDAGAAAKAARFVNGCDAFGLPLLVVVDTPGFDAGAARDGDSLRRGAELVHALAAATVPRLTLLLGQANVAMSGRELGADLLLAWPRAELAAGDGAVDEVVAPPTTRRRLASALRTFANPARPVRPAPTIST